VEASTSTRVVLDAYPVVALLRGEPCAVEVAALVRQRSAVMSAVTVAEVTDVLVRVFGQDAERVAAVLESLLDETIAVEVPGTEAATRAGLIRARWYQPRVREVSLGDCFVLATAQSGDVIATADPVIADVARAEALGVEALPDSSGRRP
jgi:uncharacterized protein with PIN domain